MKILAIETSCESGSVALVDDEAMLQQTLPGSGAGHSANILPVIQMLLAQAQWTVRDMDVIAFGAGPGAFTGVRLACSIAQGLALGADKPVASIDNLLALAQSVTQDKVYCALDARMQEAYIACYVRKDGQLRRQLGPVCVSPAQAPLPQDAGWVGVGTAFRAYADILQAVLAANVRVLDAQAVPQAGAVACLAKDRSLWRDAADVAPCYVRDRVALTIAERLAQGGKA